MIAFRALIYPRNVGLVKRILKGCVPRYSIAEYSTKGDELRLYTLTYDSLLSLSQESVLSIVAVILVREERKVKMVQHLPRIGTTCRRTRKTLTSNTSSRALLQLPNGKSPPKLTLIRTNSMSLHRLRPSLKNIVT